MQGYFNFNDDIGFSLSLLLSILCFFLLLKLENKSPLKFLKIFSIDSKEVLPIIILAISLSFFSLGFGDLLTKFIKDNSLYTSNDNLSIYAVIHIALLAPICEEIFFRGIIFPKLKSILPFFLANIIQAVIFGYFHGNIINILGSIICGIVLALIYSYTNNLTNSILLHSFHNILIILFNLLSIDIAPFFSILISFLALVLYVKLIKHNINFL